MKPQITLSNHFTIEEGSQANVSCQVTGYPKPKISWKRLGIAMPRNVEFKDSQSSMIMRKVGQSSAGTYECVADNQAGSAKALTFLMVLQGKLHCLL